ncbi:MAG: ATP-binding protein [Planctomycetota bacterium]
MYLDPILQDQNPWWDDPGARRAIAYPVRRDLHAEVFRKVGRLDDRRAALVVGPRQVGKTVLLLQTADALLDADWPPRNLTYFDFSDDRLPTRPEMSPRQVTETRPPGGRSDRPHVFLLDEIGRCPNWAPWLKQAVERTRDRFVVTDSAASRLRLHARESGLGRWDDHHMEGLSFREFLRLVGRKEEREEDALLRLASPLERYLTLGGFPEHATSEAFDEVRRRIRSAVAEKAVGKDLADEDLDLPRVKDLFVYLVQDSGAIFDAAARGRDLGSDPRSVRRWSDVLQETLLVVPLHRRTPRASARLRAKPRLYAADHGLIVAFAPIHAEASVRSRVFEAVVYRHLRDAARTAGGEIGYFRTDEDLEVDFVVDERNRAIAIEVTCSATPDGEKIDRLRRAAGRMGASSALLVHGGTIEQVRGPVVLVPLPSFLMDPLAFLRRRAP